MRHTQTNRIGIRATGVAFCQKSFITLVFIMFLLFPLVVCAIPSSKHRDHPPINNSAARDSAFYNNIKTTAESNWLLRTLYPIVFNADSTQVVIQVRNPSFENYRGKIIRNIEVISLEVFPPDSSNWNSGYSLVAKVGNKVHINTRDWVIRNNLFFNSGDPLNPETMRFNLNYLTNLTYIDEAQILIVNSRNSPDSVDVIVAVRDKFAIKVGGKIKSAAKFGVNIDDQNFLGLGNNLNTEWDVDTKRQGSVDWKALYHVPNIRGSFIHGELGWADITGFSWQSMQFYQPFLYPLMRSAGGLDISKTWISAPVDTTEVDKTILGGWYGYCFKGIPGPANQYSYLALSLQQTWFSKRPPVGYAEGKLWHESLLVLGSVALTESDSRYLPNVYSLFEDDDLHAGFLFEILFGKEFGEYRNRNFLGLRGAWGGTLTNDSYVYLKAGVESFFAKEGMEQGIVALEPLFISPRHSWGRFKARSFVRGRMILGNNRFSQEFVRLSTDPYLRGNRYLTGTSLFALGLEEDVNLPWSLLSFKFSAFVFVDGALVKNNTPSSLSDNQITTEGFGIRIRNPRLTWNSLECSVAWNQGKGHQDSAEFAVKAKIPLRLSRFEGGRPTPYTFE